MSAGVISGRARPTAGASRLLWVLQGTLAVLFLFAGGMKLTMSIPVLAQQSGLPGGFMRCIACAEITGALGLVLPGVLRIGRGLTPLAATGLVAIMIGASVTSGLRHGAAAAAMPLCVGILLVVLARGRRAWLGGAGHLLPQVVFATIRSRQR
jgi:hypothetical protein